MRVAVIGAKGSAGQRHCAAFQAEGCEVVECDIDGPTDTPVADVISIATPDDLHADDVMEALQKTRRHVFCEKPITHDPEELSWIEAAARAPGLTFSCNLPLRHSAKLDGFCLTGCIWGQYVWGRPAKWGGWRGDIENYSIVAGGGIHLIDLLIREHGQPNFISASRNGRTVHARVNFMEDDFTYCNFWFDFESSGDHRVTLVNDNRIIKFDEPNDFRAPIREFLEDIKAGRSGNGLEAIAANRVCLQIEEAANG